MGYSLLTRKIGQILGGVLGRASQDMNYIRTLVFFLSVNLLQVYLFLMYTGSPVTRTRNDRSTGEQGDNARTNAAVGYIPMHNASDGQYNRTLNIGLNNRVSLITQETSILTRNYTLTQTKTITSATSDIFVNYGKWVHGTKHRHHLSAKTSDVALTIRKTNFILFLMMTI